MNNFIILIFICLSAFNTLCLFYLMGRVAYFMSVIRSRENREDDHAHKVARDIVEKAVEKANGKGENHKEGKRRGRPPKPKTEGQGVYVGENKEGEHV